MGMNAMGLGLSLYAEDAASGPIAKVGKALSGLDAKAGASHASMKDVGDEVKKMGATLALAGAAGMAGLGLAMHAAGEFAGKIKEVATEADLAKFPQEEMKQVAKDLAVTYGKMPVEQAEAMYSAVAFGADDARKATDLLSAANKLAIAGVTDVKTATDALAGTARAYNVGFEKSADISDVFFKAMTMGKMKVGDLAHAMPKATGIASSLGVSYAELAGSIALLTSRGTNADEAVTGLKAALTNIIKPSSGAAAEAAKLGIKFDQATLRAKGWPKFLADIRNSSKYSADSMTKLFESVEGGNAVLQMVGGGMGDMDTMMKAMADRAGATEGGFKIMESAVDKLKAGVAVAMIDIGESLLPIKKVVVEAMLAVVTAFNSIPKPVKTFLTAIFAVASVFAFIAGTVIVGVVSIVAAFTALAGAAEAIGIALLVVSGAGVYIAIGLGLVAAAAYVLKKAFDENLGGLGDFMRESAAKTRLAWDAIVQLFTSGEFSGAVLTELDKAGNGGIKDFAIQAFMYLSRVKNFLAGFGAGFSAGFATLGPVFSGLKDALVSLFALFSGPAKDGPAEAGAAFESWGATGQRIGAAIAGAIGFVVSVVSTAIGWVTAFGKGFLTAASPVDILWGALKNLWGALAPIGAAFSQFGVGMGGAGGGMAAFAAGLGFVVGIIANVVGFMVNNIAMVVGVVSSVIGGFIGVISGIATAVGGVVGIVTSLLTGDWAGAWEGAKQVVFGICQAMISYLGIFLGAIASVVDRIGKLFGKDFGVKNAIAGFQADALGAVGGATTGQSQTGKVAAAPAFTGPPGAAPGAVPGASAPAPAGSSGAPPGGGGAPVAAAGAQQIDVSPIVAALNNQKPAVVTTNTHIQLDVDGQVLADIVDQHSAAGSARGNK